MDFAQNIARLLLKVEAVKFQLEPPFRWSSGWYSPIYCDSRLTISYPNERKFITRALSDLIQNKFPEVEIIAGVATAGIPQGALIADNLSLPMVYVRSKAKGHGKQNQIEGVKMPQKKVVLVEDIISTGGSVLQAASVLKEAEMQVLGAVAIFSYNFDQTQENFIEAEIPYFVLSNYTHLLTEYAKQNDLNEKIMASLHEWRKNPDTWKQKRKKHEN